MSLEYLIGVDGGGSGTRIVVADATGHIVQRASGAPSGLGLGIAAAWRAISQTIATAFDHLGIAFHAKHCAIGLGLAGVNNPAWATEFIAAQPGFQHLALETDGFTTLLGAHGGQPGAVIAVGTGTIGEVWFGGTQRRIVSGWGFPSGDEGGGAWMGLLAARHLQQHLDGRVLGGDLANALLSKLGGTPAAAIDWFCAANQTAFAQLAPLVLQSAADPAAQAILVAAGQELAAVATALDPQQQLPLALCGGLGQALRPWLPQYLQDRAVVPLGDSAAGALHLIQGQCHDN